MRNRLATIIHESWIAALVGNAQTPAEFEFTEKVVKKVNQNIRDFIKDGKIDFAGVEITVAHPLFLRTADDVAEFAALDNGEVNNG
jgi:hypothetical protein